MDIYHARLNGIELEMETIDDTFEKAIARYEFPFCDGALLEDMGQKAHTVKLRCFFWDDGATHNTYNGHIRLLNHLESRELFELIHPKYGIMKGCVESVSVRHDDRDMCAEIDFTFVENLRGSIEQVAHEDVAAAAEEAYVDAQQQMAEGYAADVVDELGAEGDSILNRPLDETQGILEQFQDVSLAARGYLKKVDTFVSSVEATLSEIANPANGLTAVISYGANLPGRVIGAVGRCAERYALLYESLQSAPVRFFDSFRYAMLDLENKCGFKKQIRCTAAAHAALTASTIYKSDEQSRQKLRRAEKIKSFDVLGNYLQPDSGEPVMNAIDLENSLATVRGMLQSAIDQDRTLDSLKAMARSLLEHVNTVKLEREKIVKVNLDNPLPLHLVCLKYGLPYNYAERIHSINRIKNPNFTSGEVSIYVR